jgi:hypothetical protein
MPVTDGIVESICAAILYLNSCCDLDHFPLKTQQSLTTNLLMQACNSWKHLIAPLYMSCGDEAIQYAVVG